MDLSTKVEFQFAPAIFFRQSLFAMLPSVSDLLDVANRYQRHHGIPDSTLASRLFRDVRKLAALRAGGEITVGRYAEVMTWLSMNWPDGVEWPHHVPRPSQASESESASKRTHA